MNTLPSSQDTENIMENNHEAAELVALQNYIATLESIALKKTTSANNLYFDYEGPFDISEIIKTLQSFASCSYELTAEPCINLRTTVIKSFISNQATADQRRPCVKIYFNLRPNKILWENTFVV